MRSRASRRRLSDNDIRCSASDRRWFPARPAQHVHRRHNNGKGRIQSALASAHGRNGKRRVETSSAGRAGAHRRSEALHPTRSSDVLTRIARERVPTVPHVAKTRRSRSRASRRRASSLARLFNRSYQRTPNSELRTPNSELRTPNSTANEALPVFTPKGLRAHFAILGNENGTRFGGLFPE